MGLFTDVMTAEVNGTTIKIKFYLNVNNVLLVWQGINRTELVVDGVVKDTKQVFFGKCLLSINDKEKKMSIKATVNVTFFNVNTYILKVNDKEITLEQEQ